VRQAGRLCTPRYTEQGLKNQRERDFRFNHASCSESVGAANLRNHACRQSIRSKPGCRFHAMKFKEYHLGLFR